MSKRYRSAFAPAVLLALIAVTSPVVAEEGRGASPPAGSAAAATSAWSERRLFQASYVSSPSPVPLLVLHSWTVTLVDAAGSPVDDASIEVLGGMPAHAHGLPTAPKVRPLGDGRYVLEGLKFHMPGEWSVVLRIRAGAGSDSVRFGLHL